MLTHESFQLTDAQLQAIHDYFRACAKQYAAEGEDSASEVSVTFTFTAAFGRFVVARFDGEVEGEEIESGLDFGPEDAGASAAREARKGARAKRRRRHR